MDIELLKTFLEIKNTRHFGQAAENLYLTQAAVSARIKQIEGHLGVQLFIRKRNNIQLTYEGERLVPHAETMLSAWNRAKQDVALKHDQVDQLSIGSTAGLWSYAYQDKLAAIYKACPNIALRSEVHVADDLLRMVMERSLDIAVLFDAPANTDISIMSAGKLKLVLVSSVPGVTVKSVMKENYIYVDWGTAFNMFHAKRFGETSSSILYTTMASIAEAFMLESSASAFLPNSMLGQEAFNPVEGAPSFSREVSIIYRENCERQTLIETVLPLLHL